MIFLFVPAHDGRKLRKAMHAGSDAVVLDLEDSVSDAVKGSARRAVAASVAEPPRADGPEVWVRVNATDAEFDDDVRSIDWSRVSGAFLPKAELPSTVTALAEAGARRIVPLIESAAGLAAVRELASASDRVERFAIGTWDMALDLGLLTMEDPDDSELIWQIRGELAIQSRRFGLGPPIDGIYGRLGDEAGLRNECLRVQRLGYGGKLLIHPKQIAVVRAVFGADGDWLTFAREIVDAYAAAERQGIGAIRVRGRLVDRPIAQRALALLARDREKKVS